MKEKMSLVTLIILVGITVLLIAAIPLVNAQEGQASINPTDDTFVDFSNQNSSYGGQTNLYIEKFQQSQNNWERRTWLKFNLSSVPEGATVDVAILRLYCGSALDTYNVYAYSSSDTSWTELALTWFNMPSYNTTAMDMEQVATSSRWYNWSVTYAVQKAVDGIHGGPNVVTIVLQETSFRSPVSYVTFSSKEDSSHHPELSVHWGGVVPEFPSFPILPLFMIATLLAVIVYERKCT
jgi:endoglucanase